MITKVDFSQYTPQVIEQLGKTGAFLTVGEGAKTNTMTIGWGAVGRVWSLPVFTVLVRQNRYTHQLIEKSKYFSVSIPLDDSLDRQLEFCGRNSGRDVDKYKECGLRLKPGQSIATPVIGQCPLHYECEIIYRQPVAGEPLAPAIVEQYYRNEPMHIVYCGKILSSYLSGREADPIG